MKNSDFVFIALCAIFIVMLTGCAGAVKPPILADGKWSQTNEIIHNVCIDSVLKAARNTPNLSDDLLPEAKAMYWECVIDLQGAI